jgi:hypothetical protein
MAPTSPEHSAVGRRNFLQMVAAGAGLATASVASTVEATPSETAPNITVQAPPFFART